MYRSVSAVFSGVFRLSISLTVMVSSASGQGTLADYQRAGEGPQRWGRIPNEEVRPHWLPDAVLVRVQTAGGGWRFVRCDFEGTRGPAFDHARLAGDLTHLLERDISPDRLPLRAFRERDEQLLVQLEEDDRIVAIDAEGAARVAEDGHAALFGITGRRASRDMGGEVFVTFHNDSNARVELLWLDRDERPRKYATLAPGETFRQHTFEGHVWLARAVDGPELALFEANAARPELRIRGDVAPVKPPDPKWQLQIEGHNVLLSRGEARIELTEDGSEQDAYTDQYAFSADQKWLGVVRQQPPEKHTVRLVEARPTEQLQPRYHAFQYLKPGDEIAKPRVVLFELASRKKIEVPVDQMPNAWSLGKLHWSSDGETLYLLYNRRGHQQLKVLAVSARDGSVRGVVDETSETFVDYAAKVFLHHLEQEDALLWMSERSGWNHLYYVNRGTGETRAITSGDWVVRGVEQVDQETRTITFRALGVHGGQDPYHVHYGRVGFDGGPITWLTKADGTHRVQFAPHREHYLATHSRVDLPPVHVLHRARDGAVLTEVTRSSLTALQEDDWTLPERFVAKGRDGATDIWGVIFYPSTFDPQRKYPVIENIYAGPHSHFVPKAFRGWHGSRQLAELGFIVVRIDGMGTNWRSKAFHDVCWKNLGDSGFPDRIAWIRAAAQTRPFMDLTRVGIYGGSAGGQSALRAMLAHGDFYHAAVADCGCHDNRMDKIWWNELWMSWPIGPHYEEQSNVTQAHKLQGKLLLIVGAMDRNVDPSSTMQVVDALIKADKDFELLVMPSTGHGAAEIPYGVRRRQDFFVRHLLGATPRSGGEGANE